MILVFLRVLAIKKSQLLRSRRRLVEDDVQTTFTNSFSLVHQSDQRSVSAIYHGRDNSVFAFAFCVLD